MLCIVTYNVIDICDITNSVTNIDIHIMIHRHANSVYIVYKYTPIVLFAHVSYACTWDI